jgi:hypothetical protein
MYSPNAYPGNESIHHSGVHHANVNLNHVRVRVVSPTDKRTK